MEGFNWEEYYIILGRFEVHSLVYYRSVRQTKDQERYQIKLIKRAANARSASISILLKRVPFTSWALSNSWPRTWLKLLNTKSIVCVQQSQVNDQRLLVLHVPDHDRHRGQSQQRGQLLNY